MRKFGTLFMALVLALSLAACSKDNDADKDAAKDTPGVEQGDGQQEPGQQDEDATNEDVPADDPGQGKSVEPPAPTIEIPMLLEGMEEKRTATLSESGNGYYMYLLPNFVFTPEEPNVDQVYMNNFEDFYMRIYTLNDEIDVDEVKSNAEEELRMLGDVEDMKTVTPDDELVKNAVFYLGSANSDLSKYIIGLKIDGRLLKVTMNLPHTEPLEGASPAFSAMAKTIQLKAE